jgi:tetratricopeptide (TPR) repeat protein
MHIEAAMRHKAHLLAAAVITALACAPVQAAALLSDAGAICPTAGENKGDQHAVIAACNVLLGSQLTNHQRALAHAFRGMANANLKNYDLALADFNAAIALEPNSAPLLSNRGEVYRLMGQFERAIGDFDAAIRIDPRDRVAFANRGTVYRRLKQYERALADYDAALELEPNDFKTLNNQCWLRAEWKHELEKAVADCDAALRLRPNDATTLDSRGFVRF